MAEYERYSPLVDAEFVSVLEAAVGVRSVCFLGSPRGGGGNWGGGGRRAPGGGSSPAYLVPRWDPRGGGSRSPRGPRRPLKSSPAWYTPLRSRRVLPDRRSP